MKLTDEDIDRFLATTESTETTQRDRRYLLRAFAKWLGDGGFAQDSGLKVGIVEGGKTLKLTLEDLKGFIGRGYSESSKRTILYTLKDFVGRELNEDEVRKYAKERYENPLSYNKCLAYFKSLAKWKRSKIPPVGEERLMQRFELEQIGEIRREKVVTAIEPKGLNHEQIVVVLKVYPRGSLKFSIIWLVLWFGCRPGELCALKPEMVDFWGGVVHFNTEKTKVVRRNYFDEFTALCLKKFLNYAPSYWFVYEVCKRAGIKPKSGRQTFNTLQRDPAARFVSDPMKIDWLVKTACGHTTPDIGAVYTDLVTDMEKLFKEYHYLIPFERQLPSPLDDQEALDLIEYFKEGSRTIEQASEHFGLGKASTSVKLRQLAARGLLRREQQAQGRGRPRYVYQITKEGLGRLRERG